MRREHREWIVAVRFAQREFPVDPARGQIEQPLIEEVLRAQSHDVGLQRHRGRLGEACLLGEVQQLERFVPSPRSAGDLRPLQQQVGQDEPQLGRFRGPERCGVGQSEVDRLERVVQEPGRAIEVPVGAHLLGQTMCGLSDFDERPLRQELAHAPLLLIQARVVLALTRRRGQGERQGDSDAENASEVRP